jgi:hypothetical protein
MKKKIPNDQTSKGKDQRVILAATLNFTQSLSRRRRRGLLRRLPKPSSSSSASSSKEQPVTDQTHIQEQEQEQQQQCLHVTSAARGR